MPIENSKAHEIKRLTTPLSFKNSKAYDANGKLIKCTETLSDVRFIVEPNTGILSDDEVLQYAPQSKLASSIRLKRGFGDIEDILLVYESLPWFLGLYYVILICMVVPVLYSKNAMWMFLFLILFIVPLVYLYYIFNLKRYENKQVNKLVDIPQNTQKSTVQPLNEDAGLESLKKYEKEVNNLKVLFDVKQEVVRDLIKKRFEPPQITYDKFISTIDNSQELFNIQKDAALNIIHLAAEDTPRVQEEINNKIQTMKQIINQIEELTNELVINISSDDESTQEVKNLLDDMDNLVESVKDY